MSLIVANYYILESTTTVGKATTHGPQKGPKKTDSQSNKAAWVEPWRNLIIPFALMNLIIPSAPMIIHIVNNELNN
jgi:hypothetical protein